MSYLLTPRHGQDVCRRCFNATRPGFDACFACTATEPRLDGLAPISYCFSGSQLHHDLLEYKATAQPAVPFLAARLASILNQFLESHERCLITACGGTQGFDLVTTVPSNSERRDEHHPLRRVVGSLTLRTRGRYQRLLRRSDLELPPRTFHPRRFIAEQDLTGRHVLLIDDVWTTGSSAESAAAALKRAGAATVGAVVIGRYVNGDWLACGERLGRSAQPPDEHLCALCARDHAVAA